MIERRFFLSFVKKHLRGEPPPQKTSLLWRNDPDSYRALQRHTLTVVSARSLYAVESGHNRSWSHSQGIRPIVDASIAERYLGYQLATGYQIPNDSSYLFGEDLRT